MSLKCQRAFQRIAGNVPTKLTVKDTTICIFKESSFSYHRDRGAIWHLSGLHEKTYSFGTKSNSKASDGREGLRNSVLIEFV